MNDVFLTYEHFYFVLETSIAFKISFIYIYIFITNFIRCCGWLWFAAQPKLLIFTLGIQTFVLAIIINRMIDLSD